MGRTHPRSFPMTTEVTFYKEEQIPLFANSYNIPLERVEPINFKAYLVILCI